LSRPKRSLGIGDSARRRSALVNVTLTAGAGMVCAPAGAALLNTSAPVNPSSATAPNTRLCTSPIPTEMLRERISPAHKGPGTGNTAWLPVPESRAYFVSM